MCVFFLEKEQQLFSVRDVLASQLDCNPFLKFIAHFSKINVKQSVSSHIWSVEQLNSSNNPQVSLSENSWTFPPAISWSRLNEYDIRSKNAASFLHEEISFSPIYKLIVLLSTKTRKQSIKEYSCQGLSWINVITVMLHTIFRKYLRAKLN